MCNSFYEQFLQRNVPITWIHCIGIIGTVAILHQLYPWYRCYRWSRQKVNHRTHSNRIPAAHAPQHDRTDCFGEGKYDERWISRHLGSLRFNQTWRKTETYTHTHEHTWTSNTEQSRMEEGLLSLFIHLPNRENTPKHRSLPAPHDTATRRLHCCGNLTHGWEKIDNLIVTFRACFISYELSIFVHDSFSPFVSNPKEIHLISSVWWWDGRISIPDRLDRF